MNGKPKYRPREANSRTQENVSTETKFPKRNSFITAFAIV